MDFTEAELTEMYERSKDDRAMFVGSEIRVLVSMARRALPSSSTAPRADAIPPPDDSGPPCDACKGRGWFVGDCHPREVCGTCNGTGRPQSWAAQEIVRLDREIARLRCAALAPRQPSDPLPVRTRRRLSGEELQAAMERANPRPSLEDMNLDEPARQPSEPPAMGWKLTGNVVEPVAAPARQPSEMLLGAGYSGGGMSVHAIDPADRSRSLCGATMTSTIGEAFDPTSKHACPRCVAARQPSDTDTARCPTGTCAVDSPRITETGCWCCGAKAGEPCRHVPDWARPSGTARCPKCAGPTEFATLHRDGSRRRFFVCTDPSCGGGVWLPSPPSSTTPEKP
jgi:hypothetical protein